MKKQGVNMGKMTHIPGLLHPKGLGNLLESCAIVIGYCTWLLMACFLLLAVLAGIVSKLVSKL